MTYFTTNKIIFDRPISLLYLCPLININQNIIIMFTLVILFAIYFIPTIIAYSEKKVNSPAILILNLLLGWTFIGWVIALVWAIKKD